MSEEEKALKSLQAAIQILTVTGRLHYAADAYHLMMAGMALFQQINGGGKEEHATGAELCRCAAELARHRFGPFARGVLMQWGVITSLDMGKIIFDLVSVKVLRLSPGDSLKDFHGALDFRKFFDEPYDAKAPYPDLPVVKLPRNL